MASLTIARALSLLGLVLLVGVTTTGPACACSCNTITDQEAYANADAVFTGRVVEHYEDSVRWPPWETDDSFDLAILVFEVSVVNKGTVARRQRVRDFSSRNTCSLGAKKGREYLVFAQRDGSVLRVNSCGGTRAAGQPLSVPSVPKRPPTPGDAQLDPTRDVSDGMPIGVRVAIVGGLAALVTAGLFVVFVVRHRRRGRT